MHDGRNAAVGLRACPYPFTWKMIAMELYTITAVREGGISVHTVADQKFDTAISKINAKLYQECSRELGTMWVHLDLPEWDPKVVRNTPLGNITFYHEKHTV